MMRIIMAEWERSPELCYQEFIAKTIGVIKKIVQRGIKRRELRDGAAKRLPQIWIATGIMVAIQQMTFQPCEPIALDQFLEANLDLITNGINVDR